VAVVDPFREAATLAEALLDEEVAEYLKAQGFGNREGELHPVIYVGQAPEGGNAIVVLEEGGGAPIAGGHTDQPIGEHRTVSVEVLHSEYRRAKAVAQRVGRALHLKQGILSSVQVAWMSADTNPIYLGLDPDRRHRFTQLFSATTKPIAAP
jgi:hypothetical protein